MVAVNAEVEEMEGSREHGNPPTGASNSSSSSQDEADNSYGGNNSATSDDHQPQPHLQNVIVVEQRAAGSSSQQNRNNSSKVAEVKTGKGKKLISLEKTTKDQREEQVDSAAQVASTSAAAIPKHHDLNSNKFNCESCASYNCKNHCTCQRSKSLPSANKQTGVCLLSSNHLVDSSEITTIREFTSEQSNSVSGVLRFCKRRVLFPYMKLLGIMGVRPLYTDAADGCLCTLVLSKMYLFLVTLVLIMGYGLQFMTCFRRDLGFSYKDGIQNPPTGLTKSYDYHSGGSVHVNRINLTRHAELLQTSNTIIEDDDVKWFLESSICSGNVIYIYIIPSILHLTSFIYMVYLYWIYDDEHLQNLMERVFIQAAHANINYFSQRRLIRRLQRLVTVGCIWILLISGCQFLQAFFSKIYVNFWVEVEYQTTYAISAVLLFATLWQDAIQITIVISFAIHCNLICTYTELIKGRLLQHSITLPDCMKELGELNKLLSYLNDDLALGLAPLLFIDGAYATGAIVQLIINGKHLSLQMICLLVVSAILWVFLIVFPLSYAAKVSTCCQNLMDMGHMIRIRPFGYRLVAQFDLDSFLLFTSNLNLKARILKVPITTPILSALAVTLSFSVLLWGYFH